MSRNTHDRAWTLPRRDFLCATGATAAGLFLRPTGMAASTPGAAAGVDNKGTATIRCRLNLSIRDPWGSAATPTFGKNECPPVSLG